GSGRGCVRTSKQASGSWNQSEDLRMWRRSSRRVTNGSTGAGTPLGLRARKYQSARGSISSWTPTTHSQRIGHTGLPALQKRLFKNSKNTQEHSSIPASSPRFESALVYISELEGHQGDLHG